MSCSNLHHLISKTCVVISGGILAFFSMTYVYGQTQVNPNSKNTSVTSSNAPLPKVELNMTAKEFDQWIEKKSGALGPKKEVHLLVENALKERLKLGMYVTDTSVLNAVDILSDYGSLWMNDKRAAKEQGISQCKKVVQFIDEINALLDERPHLQAKLVAKAASLYQVVGYTSESNIKNKEAIRLFEVLHVDVDTRRIEVMLNLADGLYVSDKKGEAEKIYLDVLSYPFYLVDSDPEAFQILRGYYIRAGEGLIACRRGNLKALNGIYFVPATKEILDPILEKAKQEAGKK